MDGKIVTLTKPVEIFGRTIKEIAVKEPSGALFMRLGEPRIAVVTSGANSWYFVEQPTVIDSYLQKLISFDGWPDVPTEALLTQISLDDALALKRALFGFFVAAETRVAAANSV